MAQDKLWVNGPQVLDFNTGGLQATASQLPTDPGTWRYHGQSAQYSGNAQYDANGQLLFFVVDGNIYDHAGYLMADNDADPQNCRNCLVKGLQEILITPMPGTCDKYYIIGGNKAGNYNALGYSILDLSKPNPFFPGRLGAVWNLVDVQGQPVMDQQMQGSTPGITLPQVDLPSTCHLGSTGNTATRSKNAHLCILDGPANSEPRTLFVQTASSFKYGTISATGISNLQVFRTFGNSSADDILHWSGGIAVAKTSPDGVVRLARTINSDLYPASAFNVSVEVSQVTFTGNQVSDVVLASNNTDLTGTHQGIGTVHGIAFSPSGRYLYFSQATVPYIGYIDMLDPAYTVHDLPTELGLTGMGAYGFGQIACNKGPGGNSWAMYYPYAGGIGCVNNIEDPANLSWTSSLTVPGGPVAAPPHSLLATTSNPTFNQYLMDRQNYRDQQLTNQALTVCCEVNEEVPEGSHAYTFTGSNTYSTPWTPADNPLTLPNADHVYFTDDYVVEAGARLYVRDMDWRFAPDAKLVIKAGAFVQFDNCTLEGSQCAPSRWAGVVVLGKPMEAQGSMGYPANHGRLVLNASTIKDALTGVLLGQKASGGILNSTGSTFLNCRTGVDFWPYQNFIAGNGMYIANRSTLVTTTFTVNAQYPATIDFLAHAKLWKVDGIRFLACTFQNLRTTELNSLQLGQGISSLDANFSVKAGCSLPGNTPPPCPAQYLLPSRFIGLDHGIDAYVATSSRAFTVDQAEFTNNICGVLADGVLGFEVHRSNFVLGNSVATNMTHDAEFFWGGRHRGIYSHNSFGFLVDDNTATQDVNGTAPTEGFVTGYSYGHNDMVFRNHANGLETGYVGEGICADINNRALIGLTYQCNTNNGNANDIWDRQVASDPDNFPDHTIRTVQGSVYRPADNTFDQTGNGNFDIKNTNFENNTLGYLWALPQTPYKPIYNSAGVFPYNMDGNGNYIVRPANNCAARLIRIPLPNDPLDMAALLAVADSERTAYGNTRYLYDQLIDGGSTDATVEEIQESWPEDAWTLRGYLLDRSPFLTVAVLKEMMERNIMPQAMAAEICIANPDATKTEGFVEWLQNGTSHPLPAYLIDDITASWDAQTFRMSLEVDLAYHHGEMTQAIGLALSGYRADTLRVQVDSMRAVWQNLLTPAARYAEAMTYMAQNNFDSAQAVITRLPVEYKLKDGELTEQAHMLALIGLLQGVHAANRTQAELDSAEVAQLQTLVYTGHDRATEWARNLLCFGYGICRAPLTGGNGNTPRSVIAQDDASTPDPAALSVYPNPASLYATLAYDFMAAPDKAYLSIRDAVGKEVQRLPVQAAEGQTVWDTRSISPGAYTVELVNGGKTLGTAKLIVKR